jgi:phosphate/sulfate permease
MDALGFPALIALIAIAVIFDALNGLHDAANSIATIVSTRVLRPQYAVAWAAFFNFIAFLFFGLTRIIHHLLIFCGGCSAKWPIHIANRCVVELLRATAERHSRHDRRYSASL